MSQADKDAMQRDWEVAIAQAAQGAKARGKLPGGLEQFVNSTLRPKVSWKELLRDFVEKSVKNDYSFMPPNRRYQHLGVFLPSLNSKDIGTIWVAVDTSISVSDHELKQFASEATAMIETYPSMEAHVLYCDTEVKGDGQHFTFDDLPITMKVKGRGGTEFTPVFEHIAKKGETPTCLIYFTDMYCGDFPKKHPDYPVLWLSTSPQLPYGQPPFGDVVHMEDVAQ
jgi:predicted metal-dependent peptidase